jgi:hypothetical protein
MVAVQELQPEKTLKFDGSTSWAVFHCQFEAVAGYGK